MSNVAALAGHDPSGVVTRIEIPRRELGPHDVDIEIHYCGICASDLHSLKSEWGPSIYPLVPGHEITGVVRAVGSDVTKFKVGDRAGVGCMVESCRTCTQCRVGDEQYCAGKVFTYNARMPDGSVTYGGYSKGIVVVEDFAVHVPESISLADGAPLLCAGITVYSPLVHFGAGRGGKKVGVNGFGGLGHMAVKIGRAMGNEMVVFSTSERKRESVEALGASFLLSSSQEALAAHANTFDLIIDTVSAQHTLDAFYNVLKPDGQIVLLGGVTVPYQVPAFALLMKRISVAGSLIGGIRETQEMLNFCAEHNITADISLISADEVNSALEQIASVANLKPRFVIDIKNTL